MESPHKDKIQLGNHTLECTGGVRKARYLLGNKYDGLHMYGPSGRKAYTESVLQIIRGAGVIRSSPPNYFHDYHEHPTFKTQEKYVCPTQDRDYLRDRDARQTHASYQYGVQTFNRFNFSGDRRKVRVRLQNISFKVPYVAVNLQLQDF